MCRKSKHFANILFSRYITVRVSTKTYRPTIALAGGGHANLHTLRRAGELTRRGFDVVLVDPSEHLHYSGMATGVLSGSYKPGENRIGIRSLVERGGGRFVRGKVAEVLHRDRLLLLEDGRTIRYDAVSFCLGSETRGGGGTVPVKPVSNLEGVRGRLLAPEVGEPFRIAIVGGGAAGCEVAANLAALARDAGSGAEMTLVEAAPDLLPKSPKTARRIMTEHLRHLGVRVILGQPARLGSGAGLIDGIDLRADLTLAATGVAPPDLFTRSGLATGDDGAMWVDRHLRSPNETRIFGGGDSVAFRGGRLPQFGVYAVRQGPVLYRNLQAVLRGEPLSTYRPQRRYLYVLDLADGTGLAIYGSLTNRSRPALRLKRRIDRRFMQQYG
ncbi:MAG: NADH dehydrogenase-like protein / Selenide,water dikinase [uncultured Rubrobacteraceae bacterium]|uniref:NADH dehydrogenase-like protein / Selenide,water dikinase n=1 Tax=uncultured Rubrobacteraceae bacterium TaxID=349277 RepID=A0A6J4PAS9_9ACTN|nr:MAG: NADH dehydrogenase-like protein / Selenide,water dikinase [uncultured Rubrobacteraceae bacterium]